jgi:Pyruvate:ferredoxin oxidoreductase core domain II
MEQIDMAPFSAWLPARPNLDFDLTVEVVGRSASGLIDELASIVQALSLHGCQVMAQTGRLNGGSGHVMLRLRIASRPFYSMGHGCDVAVYLDQDPPKFGQFGMQPGSVLVWDPPEQSRLHPPLPDGVIVYRVPLRGLNSQYGLDAGGKGYVAMGVLASLLGFSEEARRVCLKSISASTLFDSGYQFASRSLIKHDIYSLPLATRGDARIVLNPENAVKLGFAVSHCGSGMKCVGDLERSPTQWITRHLAMADKMVSGLHSEQFPGAQVYRGPQGKVFALFRGDNASILSSLNGCSDQRVLVAADAADALRLLVVGQRLIETNRADVVGVVVEEALTARLESVGVEALAAAMSGGQLDAGNGFDGGAEVGSAPMQAEREGEDDAEVGFIAWGATQGVVRDALMLCRNVGMSVAALYPKQIVPLPVEQLESFAGTVKRVVVVESDQTRTYADRIERACSFRPSVVMPNKGTALTAMDLFMREDLGTAHHDRLKGVQDESV